MDTHRPRPRARRRDSDTVLRASVLDAAIELGIGNKTVAKWMFSPVEEGDEEQEYEQVRPFPSLSLLSQCPTPLCVHQSPQRLASPERPYTANAGSDEYHQVRLTAIPSEVSP